MNNDILFIYVISFIYCFINIKLLKYKIVVKFDYFLNVMKKLTKIIQSKICIYYLV